MPQVGIFDPRSGKRRRYAPGSWQPAAAHGTVRPSGRSASRKAVYSSKRYQKAWSKLRGVSAPVSLAAKMAIPTLIERMQAVKSEEHNFDSDSYVPGYISLSNTVNTVGADKYPVLIVPLNRINNNAVLLSGNNRLLQLDDSGAVSWDVSSANSTSNAGVVRNGGTFAVERQIYGNSTTGTVAYNATKVCYPWYDIRLQLFGMKRQTVTWDVSLVRFRHDWMCPEGDTTNADNTTTVNTFWQSYARKATLGSLTTSSIRPEQYMRVLRTRRVVIEPTKTDENAISVNSVDLKWFVREGRPKDYDRNESEQFVDDASLLSADVWRRKLLGNTVENTPKPLQRLYLLIRATDYTGTTAAGNLADFDSPSLNMIIRRKMMVLGRAGE